MERNLRRGCPNSAISFVYVFMSPVVLTVPDPRAPLIAPPKLLINNRWVDSRAGTTSPTYNPATEEEIARVAEAAAEDIDAAVGAARRALEVGPWNRMSGADRGKLLYRLADLIEKASDELAFWE